MTTPISGPKPGLKSSPRPGQKMRPTTLHLHGALAAFGRLPGIRCDRPREVVAIAAAQLPGLEAALRRGSFILAAGPEWRRLGGTEIDQPVSARELHLMPHRGGSGRGEGKMLLGLTLLGLSFVPGVQAGIGNGLAAAGIGGGEAAGLLGGRLLGGAGAWLLLSGASEALAPQTHRQQGLASSDVAPPAPNGEGAAIPLAYGSVRIVAPPVVSAGLSVQVMAP